MLDGSHIDIARFVAHNDLLLKGHLPALGVPIRRGQQAVILPFGGVAVELAFIMPYGNDAVGKVLLGAAVQLMAHGQKRLGRASVQAAGNVVFSAVIGDISRAPGAALIGIKDGLFVPEPRLLHQQ